MSTNFPIVGFGGGKSPEEQRAPVEAPDSLRSLATARIIDMTSEGEIVGLVNGLQSIFLDETRLQNTDGTFNFKNVQVFERVGTTNQLPVPGFPSVENTIGVGVELRKDTPYTRSFTNLNLSAIVMVLAAPILLSTDSKTGDVSGTIVEYEVDLAVDGGAFVKILSASFNGKTTGNYQRTHRIDLPTAIATGWTLRIRRLTDNSITQAVQNATNVISVTEVIDAKLRYPSAAYIAMAIDASQFKNIPSRAFHLKGLIIKVPSNYDPITRQYTGIWDGTFQVRYTNNPAWIFYDLVTNVRYGLGRYVSADKLDKWALYGIAQYCDELVSNGKGGTEPRFTCNCYIQTRLDAYRILQNLASVFRGVTYWANNLVVAVADKPQDPVYTYTHANVIDGKFNYQGSGRKARHTVAIVSWNDLTDFSRSKYEYVEDPAGIARYGVNELQVTAFGCTSQSQAQRIGLWMLLTERLETDTVQFQVGLDGTFTLPGQIIRIADTTRAGKRIAGRIANVLQNSTSTEITIDADLPIDVGNTFTVTLPTGVTQSSTVSNVSGRRITVTPKYVISPAIQSIWVIETPQLVAQTFRVLSVTESDKMNYTITALQHNSTKFSIVDAGNPIDQSPPITSIPARFQPAVTNLVLGSFQRAGQVVSGTVLTISWKPAQFAVRYEYRYKRTNGDWSSLYTVNNANAEVENVFTGNYVAQVWAYSGTGIKSQLVQSAPYFVPDQTLTPDVITNALENLQSISDDSILSASEKPSVITDYSAILAEQPSLTAQANNLSITTELTNYTNAISALTTYLGTLTTPYLWNDVNGDTYLT